MSWCVVFPEHPPPMTPNVFLLTPSDTGHTGSLRSRIILLAFTHIADQATYFIPRFIASDVPIIEMASNMLLQIFAAWNTKVLISDKATLIDRIQTG